MKNYEIQPTEDPKIVLLLILSPGGFEMRERVRRDPFTGELMLERVRDGMALWTPIWDFGDEIVIELDSML